MRVLIVGSLAGGLGKAAAIATSRGARLEQVDDVGSAIVHLRVNATINLVFCEVGEDIALLVRSLRHERIVIPVIACGHDQDAAAALKAVRDGAQDFLRLPPDPDLIAEILHAASGDSHTVVARDPLMLETLRRADQVAHADASVLITGESGTGKEVLAKYIQRRSARAARPFVALNCAAIPEHLLESELFGHEKGAFSGAIARRIGKFESAEGGTLLLDEISELDIRLQAKLLRAIQEREIDRVGGAAPVRVDVRILATSNRDLTVDTASGRFRADLFFRLNVVNLEIPPLRARRGDIQGLAEHYIRRYSQANGVPVRRLTEEALSRLVEHEWPGNVRELENLMHRMVLLTEGREIGADSLGLERPSSQTLGARVVARSIKCSSVSGLVGRRMEDVEQQLIIETLHHTLGNRTHAATILGISIRALRNKLRDYSDQGLSVPPTGHWAA